MSIRTKLILWYSGLLMVIIVVFGIAVFSVMRWALTSAIDRTLSTTTDQVRANSRASVIAEFGAPDKFAFDPPTLDIFGLAGVLVQIWNLSTNTPMLMDESTSIQDYHAPIDTTALLYVSALEDPNTVAYSNILKNDTEWRVRTQSMNVYGWRIAIQVAESSQAIKDANGMLLIIMLAASGISIFGSIMLGMVVSNRTLKPIKQITAAADRIVATEDLKTRLPWQGPMDELGMLTSVFNRMLERLEHLFSVQQRFVADVSHELRTPLTAIRGNLDLIKRYGADKESLEAIESEADRMARLVNELLFLARADYGELKLEMEPLDLDTVVSEVYREAKILAKDRDLKVRIIDFEPARINGNADRLKQLLLNLVSNALKFTPDGGQVTINLRHEDYDAVIEVSDTGIGISAEDKERIFDRFFQTDSSRARHHGEGVGLGLSIAKWIVESHHGTISVISEPNKGTTFTVKFPSLDTRPQALGHAITRPRLGIIRRSPSTPTKSTQKTQP